MSTCTHEFLRLCACGYTTWSSLYIKIADRRMCEEKNSIWIEHSAPTTTPLHSKPHLRIMTSPHTQRPELPVMHVRKPEYVPHLLQEHRAFHLPARTKVTKHHVIAYTGNHLLPRIVLQTPRAPSAGRQASGQFATNHYIHFFSVFPTLNHHLHGQK